MRGDVGGIAVCIAGGETGCCQGAGSSRHLHENARPKGTKTIYYT